MRYRFSIENLRLNRVKQTRILQKEEDGVKEHNVEDNERVEIKRMR